MRKRNTLFKKTGYSAKFRPARNKVTRLLRRAKDKPESQKPKEVLESSTYHKVQTLGAIPGRAVCAVRARAR